MKTYQVEKDKKMDQIISMMSTHFAEKETGSTSKAQVQTCSKSQA